MGITLPLDQMTTADKLRVMEELWADLTRNEKEFESPAWHLAVLQEREERFKAGEETPIDWETAKKELRDELDERWAAFVKDPSTALTLEEVQRRMQAIRA